MTYRELHQEPNPYDKQPTFPTPKPDKDDMRQNIDNAKKDMDK